MRKFFKWTGIILLIVISALLIYIFANQHRTFKAPYPELHAVTDSVVIEKGRSLVFGAAHCANCHAPAEREDEVNDGIAVPLSGGRVFELPIGKLYAPNLTPAATGIGKMTDGEIARSLRYGVRASGEALFDFMPFHNTSDEDLVAIISYLRHQAPVETQIRRNELNLLGKAVKAIVMKPVGPDGPIPTQVKPDTTVAYGQYLANNIANCRGCHTDRNLMTGAYTGPSYAGGLKFEIPTDSGTYSLSTPNLTPHSSGRLTGWTEQQFINRFRQGKMIKESHMPWGPFSRMSDQELKAIYKYLKTVTPVDKVVKMGVVKEG